MVNWGSLTLKLFVGVKQTRMTFSNGDEYYGSWVKNNKEGVGLYFHSNGMKYKGEWKDDKKNGLGLTKWPNGDRHTGEYVQDY